MWYSNPLSTVDLIDNTILSRSCDNSMCLFAIPAFLELYFVLSPSKYFSRRLNSSRFERVLYRAHRFASTWRESFPVLSFSLTHTCAISIPISIRLRIPLRALIFAYLSCNLVGFSSVAYSHRLHIEISRKRSNIK